MDIESELPEDFDQLSPGEKISELEDLKERLGDDETDMLKKRMLEELVRSYRD